MTNQSEVAYGLDTRELFLMMRKLISEYGNAKVAKWLSISKKHLALLASNSETLHSAKHAFAVTSRLQSAINQSAKLRSEFKSEICALRLAVLTEGLRPTARKHGVDPSNLRRKIANHG